MKSTAFKSNSFDHVSPIVSFPNYLLLPYPLSLSLSLSLESLRSLLGGEDLSLSLSVYLSLPTSSLLFTEASPPARAINGAGDLDLESRLLICGGGERERDLPPPPLRVGGGGEGEGGGRRRSSRPFRGGGGDRAALRGGGGE